MINKQTGFNPKKWTEYNGASIMPTTCTEVVQPMVQPQCRLLAL